MDVIHFRLICARIPEAHACKLGVLDGVSDMIHPSGAADQRGGGRVEEDGGLKGWSIMSAHQPPGFIFIYPPPLS